MDIARIATTRYTSKAFDPSRKIPAAQIEQLKTLLRYSPSSTNSQPWHFVLASTEAGKAKVKSKTAALPRPRPRPARTTAAPTLPICTALT